MMIFSKNIIKHISADVTVATFHEELFGSGNFKISDVVMNSTIILFTIYIPTLKFINVSWVVEFLAWDGKISLILSKKIKFLYFVNCHSVGPTKIGHDFRGRPLTMWSR